MEPAKSAAALPPRAHALLPPMPHRNTRRTQCPAADRYVLGQWRFLSILQDPPNSVASPVYYSGHCTPKVLIATQRPGDAGKPLAQLVALLY